MTDRHIEAVRGDAPGWPHLPAAERLIAERDALRAEVRRLRAQRDAALAECDVVARSGYTLRVKIRAALGVQPEGS
jgi:hypothetical protein